MVEKSDDQQLGLILELEVRGLRSTLNRSLLGSIIGSGIGSGLGILLGNPWAGLIGPGLAGILGYLASQ